MDPRNPAANFFAEHKGEVGGVPDDGFKLYECSEGATKCVTFGGRVFAVQDRIVPGDRYRAAGAHLTVESCNRAVSGRCRVATIKSVCEHPFASPFCGAGLAASPGGKRVTTTYFTYSEDLGVTAFKTTFGADEREREYVLQGRSGLLRAVLKAAEVPETWPGAELMDIAGSAEPPLSDSDKGQLLRQVGQRDYDLAINYLAVILRHAKGALPDTASARLAGFGSPPHLPSAAQRSPACI